MAFMCISVVHELHILMFYIRYGQPELAVVALNDSSSRVSSENFHFWLSALHSVAAAESLLSKAEENPLLQTRLTLASNLYLRAFTSLKVMNVNILLLTCNGKLSS
jgi:hypothetical protein